MFMTLLQVYFKNMNRFFLINYGSICIHCLTFPAIFMSPNQQLLEFACYYKMLLKSQLLFINYKRLLHYPFCLSKITTVKTHQQNNPKNNMKKQAYTFFKICNDHEQIFKEEGLFNFKSEKIKNLLEQKTMEFIVRAKNWLDCIIQVDQINSAMFDSFLNFQLSLLKKKDSHPQIQALIAQRDEKTLKFFLQPTRKPYGVKKLLDFLAYSHKSKKEIKIEIFKDKIKSMIQDQNHLVAILKQILKDEQLSDSFKKSFIETISIDSNISVLINAHTPLSFIPQTMYSSQKKLFFEALRQRIQNEQTLIQLKIIFKQLISFKEDRQIISMIIIIINKLIKRIRDRRTCVKLDGAEFIQKILENQQSKLLFYYLIQNKYDSTLQNFIDLKQFQPFEKKNWFMRFLICILAHKKQKSLEQQAIQAVRPAFKNISTFLTVYQSIRIIHLQQFFPQLASYFKKQIFALQNPFVDRGHYTLQEKALYIQFFFRSFHYSDKHQLVKKCKDLITYDIKKEVIKYHLDQHCTLQPQKYCIYFINQGFDDALKIKDKQFLKLGIILLQKYEKIGVERTQNQYSELKFWKLFNNYIQNINFIFQIGLGKQIIEVLKSFITNNYKYYKQDYHYRQLLKSLLNHLKAFEIYPHFMILIIKSAMKYPNIFDPKVLTDIKITRDSMKIQQYRKFLTIKGEKSELDLLNEKNLSILFINQTYSSQIKLHKTRIVNIINCAKMSSCIEAINSFGMNANKDSNEILKALLMRIVKEAAPEDIKGKIDIMGLFLSCLKNQQFFMIEFNSIWHFIIKIYHQDCQELTIQMHIFLIQFAFTQSSSMLDHKLFMNYLRNILNSLYSNMVTYQSTELSLFYEIARSGLIKFSVKDIKKIKSLMKGLDIYHSKLKGTSFFIYLQKQLEEHQKTQQITKFQEYHKKQLESSNQYQPFIYDLHYAYMKNKFPKLMANLNLSKEHLQPYLFTMEYKMDALFLKELMQELKTPLSYSLKFGGNNIIQINNFFLVFLHPYKNGCIGQQKTIANIIQCIHGQKCKVIFLIYYGNQTFEIEILKTLSQSYNLLSKQIYEKLKTRVQQRKQVQRPINFTYSYTDFIPQEGYEISLVEFDDKESEEIIDKQQ